MRVLFALFLMVSLSGCAVWNYLFQCDTCALAADDAASLGEGMGILAVGLTVTVADGASVGIDDGTVEGSIGWMGQSLTPPPEADEAPQPQTRSTQTTTLDLQFPDGLKAGEHRLVLWRVPPGRWAVRHGRMGSGDGSLLSGIFTPWSVTTRVEPGRVSYAGEIHITARPGPPQIEIGHDFGFARDAVSAYPFVNQPLQDVPFTEVHREKRRGH